MLAQGSAAASAPAGEGGLLVNYSFSSLHLAQWGCQPGGWGPAKGVYFTSLLLLVVAMCSCSLSWLVTYAMI